jgi:nucleoside-diphosphate kinase
MERSLVLIKPDGVQRGNIGKIIDRFERRGLRLVAMKLIKMDNALAEKHYAVHKEKPFFKDLVKFITSSPIVAMVWEANDAVEIIRQTMGSTNAAKAAPGTIRGDFGIDLQQNLVHGSDSLENATKEIATFFKPEELLSYSRDMDRWITGS